MNLVDQEADAVEEALACFERSHKNATCVVRLIRVIKNDNSSLDHLYTVAQNFTGSTSLATDSAAFSPTIQQVLIDAVPMVGGRVPQLWLAAVLQDGLYSFPEKPSDLHTPFVIWDLVRLVGEDMLQIWV